MRKVAMLICGVVIGFGLWPVARSIRRHFTVQPAALPPVVSTLEPIEERVYRHLAFVDWAKNHHRQVLFLGDSLTDFWRDRPEMFDAQFPDSANFGEGLDKIQNLLWRINAGEIGSVHPKVVVLLIGANNLEINSEDEIVSGIQNLIDVIRSQQPQVKILLIGLLPTDWFGTDPDGTKKVRRINAKLATFGGITFVDFGSQLLKPDGSLDTAMQPDHIHLSPQGYAVWANAVKPTLDKLLSR
jgi:lysophospholipase L1-like esterase